MRWFTCTPVAFGGGPDFFARDSGLMCRGFQSIGCESRAVMPGPAQTGDEADLIRTDFANLESAGWWKSHHLDGVVLYAWGSPKYRKVAAAIHEAGIFLVLNQDNGGLVSPLAGVIGWFCEQWILAGQGRGHHAILRFVTLTARGLTAGIFLTDPLRAAHLKQGNIIACVSPRAADSYRRLCRLYGGAALAKRVKVIPHAVEQRFRYSGVTKRRQIACVGRWQDIGQKRPWLLTGVIEALVASDNKVSVVIAGGLTEELVAWHRALAATPRNQIKLRGHVGRNDLAEILGQSQVFFSPSAFESFGIAAAEALCAGCSVVAGKSVSMASFDWFVSTDSGTLADGSAIADYLTVIQQELALWEGSGRNPARISNIWCTRLHADRVATLVLELFRGQRLKK